MVNIVVKGTQIPDEFIFAAKCGDLIGELGQKLAKIWNDRHSVRLQIHSLRDLVTTAKKAAPSLQPAFAADVERIDKLLRDPKAVVESETQYYEYWTLFRDWMVKIFPEDCFHKDGVDAAVAQLFQKYDSTEIDEDYRLHIYHLRAVMDPDNHSHEMLPTVERQVEEEEIRKKQLQQLEQKQIEERKGGKKTTTATSAASSSSSKKEQEEQEGEDEEEPKQPPPVLPPSPAYLQGLVGVFFCGRQLDDKAAVGSICSNNEKSKVTFKLAKTGTGYVPSKEPRIDYESQRQLRSAHIQKVEEYKNLEESELRDLVVKKARAGMALPAATSKQGGAVAPVSLTVNRPIFDKSSTTVSDAN